MLGRMLEYPEVCADHSHIGKQEEKTEALELGDVEHGGAVHGRVARPGSR